MEKGLRPTIYRVSPKELGKKTDDFTKVALLGEGAHGKVWQVVIKRSNGTEVRLAYKEAKISFFSGNEELAESRTERAETWVVKIREMQKAGILVVPGARAIEGQNGKVVIMCDLTQFGLVSDMDKELDLKKDVLNYEYVIVRMAKQMARIHSLDYVMTDLDGTLGFRAWFLIKNWDEKMNGFIGSIIVEDVGGIEKEVFTQRPAEQEMLKEKYALNNVLSLCRLAEFDLELTTKIITAYMMKLKKIEKYGEIFVPSALLKLLVMADELQKKIKTKEGFEELKNSYNVSYADASGTSV